ncbi:MAG: hypothetical protein ACI30A_06860 [Paludibacteraceae bacterium]
MARFAQYYIQFAHDFAPCDWAQRQAHLGALFEKDDSMVFRIGEGTEGEYKHRVYHLGCNRNIIVMGFANQKEVALEQGWERRSEKNEPSCYVLFDNRKNMRTVAIQKRKEAFNNPTQVAKILESHIHDCLNREYGYMFRIIPYYYPKDFYTAWEREQKHIASVCFNTPNMGAKEIMQRVAAWKAKDKPYYDDSLMGALVALTTQAKADKYRSYFTVRPDMDNKAILPVDKSSIYIRNMVTLSAATGEPIELITTDGARYRCLVDTDEDNTDMIITQEFDTHILEMLFRGKDEQGNDLNEEQTGVLEGKVVELMNSIIHESEDIEGTGAA